MTKKNAKNNNSFLANISKSTLAGIAVIGFVITAVLGAFNIWSHFKNEPSRQISYQFTNTLKFDSDQSAGFAKLIQNDSFKDKNVYLVEVKLWNSGNKELELEHFKEPLKINFPENSIGIEKTIHHVGEKSFHGDVTKGFKFKKLFPNSGISIRYFSTKEFNTGDVKGIYFNGLTGRGDMNFVPENFRQLSQEWNTYALFFLGGVIFILFASLGHFFVTRPVDTITDKIFVPLSGGIFGTFLFFSGFLYYYELIYGPPF